MSQPAACPPLAELMRARDWPGAERCARLALGALSHPPASTYGILGRVLEGHVQRLDLPDALALELVGLREALAHCRIRHTNPRPSVV